MAFLEIHGLRKAFVTPRGTTEVLGGVDLALEEGEFVAVVGYSGSGKTTLVNLVAGLLTADAGDIVLDGERVSEPGPERGIVFQQYSLLPWMTVHENVALAVDAVNPGVPARERRRITDELVGLVNLTPAAWKRPRELSGGMRQRVAVARGLAMQPKLLLMDEPFSALDALTRATLQEELLRISLLSSNSIMFITHNVDEAVFLGDRVVVMTKRPGRIKAVVPVPVPRQERTVEAMAGAQFVSLTDHVLHLVREEVQ